MCDFRNPPIKVLKGGKEIEFEYKGEVGVSLGFNLPLMSDVTELGVYYICASGSGYGYYDGNGSDYSSNWHERLCYRGCG